MGTHMPYQLEKGPYFSVTEAVLEDIPRRIDTLVMMRQPEPDLEHMPTIDSSSLDTIGGADQTVEMRTRHQNEHWYGKQQHDDGTWATQQRFDASDNRSTGYWQNWYGNAEAIVRETYTRAIEVSLGIEHEPNVTDPQHIADSMTRAWLIEIFNRCPAPWFEGWVTWRAHPGERAPGQIDTNGHVTVHLHTPSHSDSALQMSPVRADRAHLPDYKDETDGEILTSLQRPRGMWVISHEVQELVPPPETAPPAVDPPGPAVPVPWFGGTVWSHDRGATTSDKVIVVQPSEPDGGVLAQGHEYTP